MTRVVIVTLVIVKMNTVIGVIVAMRLATIPKACS